MIGERSTAVEATAIAAPVDEASPGIGRLRERSLHAALKAWFWKPGDETEVAVDGYVIDLIHDRQLIEVQTRGLVNLRGKLEKLLPEHDICIVYPLPLERWIVTLDAEGEHVLRRRKSPKRGRPVDLFDELYGIADLFLDPRLTLKLALTREEEVRRDDGKGSWRRRGISIIDRVLLQVVQVLDLRCAADVRALLPALSMPLTHHDLTTQAHIRPRLAQRTSMSLRKLGLLETVGRSGRTLIFDWTPVGRTIDEAFKRHG